ncbi:cell division ATP-binding protein FtsE [Patescibacteria group bacterium]|nr:cell division ATP-binding protein FtsE [Patescibacteria group bacterium]MBU1931465.1 cell division ATP-binding protein FtsE [Patescibacteria group bacterium]
MIKFDKVSKNFGQTTALNQADFTIKKGEFVFLVGPSGAGKTTILRLLLKEIVPDSGKITFLDQDLSQLPAKEIPQLRRKIGSVFQDYKLLTERTVFENTALPLEINGLERDKIKSEAAKVLALVGLKNRMNFFPAQLSGGELQRVVIARAIVAGPELVFADEPTGNLDAGISWQIVKLLKKINDQGTTVIMATHDREIVAGFPQRVIELKKGKVTDSLSEK